MNGRRMIFILALLMLLLPMGSCIHEYPSGSGVDPSKILTGIEIEFDLEWDYMIKQKSSYSSRSSLKKPHRFIIEITRNGEVTGRDYEYLSDDEFSQGILRHKLSFPLSARTYDLIVWYDRDGENSDSPNYNIEDLNRISFISKGIEYSSEHHSAFSREVLNLREYEGQTGITVIKNIKLSHTGAKFELIATDINEFITENRPALLQGDSFSIKLSLEKGSSGTFNIFTGKINHDEVPLERTGKLLLPFAEYDELKIAEGFLFCDEEEDMKMTLSVFNSAQIVVTRTEPFTLPVKRGIVTILKGDFLTHPLNSPITVDHIWAGEHIIEI